MKNLAFADALANVPVVNPSVINKEQKSVKTKKHKSVAVVPAVIVTPTTLTITQAQLQELLDAAAETAVTKALAENRVQVAVTSVVPDGPRQATKPEACASHKLLSLLNRGASSVIVATRDHVAVPVNIWAVDKAAPQGLAVVAAGAVVVASGAAKVTGYFARLAEKAAAKSLALRVQ